MASLFAMRPCYLGFIIRVYCGGDTACGWS
jgi:hypothetical protein